MAQADSGSIISIVLHDAIAIAQSKCVYGWAAQVFKCFAEHGKYSPLVAGAPVEVQPDSLDELQPAFQMQHQAAFAMMLCPWTLNLALAQGCSCAHIAAGFSCCKSHLPSLLESPYEHCKVADNLEISHGVSALSWQPCF